MVKGQGVIVLDILETMLSMFLRDNLGAGKCDENVCSCFH